MTTIAQLGVDLTANSAKFISELGKAQAALNSHAAQVNRSLTSIKAGFDSLRSAAATFGVGLGAGAIAAWGKEALKAASEIGILAAQLGISATAVQAYQFAATSAGIGVDVMRSAIMRLTASIGEAEQGNDATIKAFDGMGVKILDAGGKVRSTEAIFTDIARAFENAGDKAKFAADMKTLLGRSAQELNPILAAVASGTDNLAAAADRAGVMLSDPLRKQADEANKSLDLLWGTIKIKGEEAWASMAPGITNVTDKLRELINTAGAGTKSLLSLYDATVGKNPIDAWWRNLIGVAPASGHGATGSFGPAATALSGGMSSGSSAPGASNPISAAAKQRAEAIQKVIDGLKLQVDFETRLAAADQADSRALENLNDAYEIGQALQANKISLSSREGQEIAALIVKRNEEKRAVDASKKGYDDFLAALDKNSQAYQQMRDNVAGSITEIESQIEQNRIGAQTFGMTAGQIAALNEQRKIQNQLLKDHNVLLPDEATRLNADLKTLQRTTDELARQKAASAELANFATSAFDRIGQAIDNAILQKGAAAFNDFKNIALAVVQEIENAFIKLAIMNPIQKMLGLPGSSNLPTLTDFLSGIFGGGGGASSGLTASSLLDVQLGSFPFHSGGIVGGGSPSRLVPAMAFASAPRFHSGGFIGAGEVPVIARKGEGIFTPEQMAAMGGDVINVNLAIQTGVVGTVRAEVMQMLPTIAKTVSSAIQDKRSRGKVRSLA